MATERPAGHDVTCPACGEPVGVRATFCMHCGRDLPDRVEYDDVTGETEADDGGETLLSRLRPGKRSATAADAVGDADTPPVVGASTESVEAQAVTSDRSATGNRTATADRSATTASTGTTARSATGGAGATPGAETTAAAGGGVGFRTDDGGRRSAGRIPVPSGLGSDGPSLLPTAGRLDALDQGAKLLGALAIIGAVGVGGLGMSPPAAGALLALLAWTVSVATIARRHAGFDAMRYGSFTGMFLLIFVAFGLAFGSEGSGLVALGLTLVPVGIAALFVAGFGYSMADSAPE